MNRVLKNNLWWILPTLFFVMAVSEILVAYFTIGHKYITGYFAIIESVMFLILIVATVYCLIMKGIKFRILTILMSLIMIVTLVVMFIKFSLPHTIAPMGLNRYLTFGQSAGFWYRIDRMETDKALETGVYTLSDSHICVNINFIVAIVIGLATVIMFINQNIRSKKDERRNLS